MDDKYVVFKRDEFRDWYQTVESHGGHVPMALDDAVVIRRQDVFAPPSLDAYANAITVALELTTHGVSQSERSKKLRNIADYFHDQAVLAWETDRKIPD